MDNSTKICVLISVAGSFLAKPVIAQLYLGKMSSKNAPLLPHHLVSNYTKFQSKQHSDLKMLSILNIVGIAL